MSNQKKWDSAYLEADIGSALPATILRDNHYLLPEGGDALDLACGRAGNALFLATIANKHFQVDAIDYSSTVINALKEHVKKEKLPITAILRNIEENGLQDEDSAKKYDVIIVSYFLNRELFPKILSALKPRGLLFYQTWSQEKVDDSGPSNPDFRLKSGELLTLCSGLTPLLYQENGRAGDINKGLRNEALIIAKKSSK